MSCSGRRLRSLFHPGKLRIEKQEWKQATITEATECSKSCPASGELMYLEKR